MEAKSNAAKIWEFHNKIGASLPQTPAVPAAEVLKLRQTLIDEEYAETAVAFTTLRAALEQNETPDMTLLIHELADLLYVTYGAIWACGVDPDPIFAELHRANMQKVNGPRRADGKVLKPPDWQPADIAGIIAGMKPNNQLK